MTLHRLREICEKASKWRNDQETRDFLVERGELPINADYFATFNPSAVLILLDVIAEYGEVIKERCSCLGGEDKELWCDACRLVDYSDAKLSQLGEEKRGL